MNKPVYAIIGVKDEAQSIENVLRQLWRSKVAGAMVICNGCTDESYERTQAIARTSPYPICATSIPSPLGHDVARAVGTYALLRRLPVGAEALCLYIDGDWSGAFGPALHDFITFGIERDADVLSLSRTCLVDDAMRTAATSWQQALTLQQVVPVDALPFMVPMLVHTRLFHQLSPLLLAHPGVFIARCAMLQSISWHTFDVWDLRLTGHRSRNRQHAQAMRARIALDGRTAHAILSGRRCKNTPSPSGIPPRNFAALLSCAAQATWPLPRTKRVRAPKTCRG
ncbi:hypothetical protein AAC03nite_21420 [Alicyclobacillus acidoterrestris]|uniref:hypothetical protein n=1 Tax=Alicyclobacillus suci TaxID=2816080 RepID=UPI00118FA42C|nr:hypothetical protein [Alicyclobacillus suci]GEO26357.1 hypothetical protein AAC03nite_21420 [Alicyclobacillus acidoterrestris]